MRCRDWAFGVQAISVHAHGSLRPAVICDAMENNLPLLVDAVRRLRSRIGADTPRGVGGG